MPCTPCLPAGIRPGRLLLAGDTRGVGSANAGRRRPASDKWQSLPGNQKRQNPAYRCVFFYDLNGVWALKKQARRSLRNDALFYFSKTNSYKFSGSAGLFLAVEGVQYVFAQKQQLRIVEVFDFVRHETVAFRIKQIQLVAFHLPAGTRGQHGVAGRAFYGMVGFENHTAAAIELVGSVFVPVAGFRVANPATLDTGSVKTERAEREGEEAEEKDSG